jgi:hypothetical protein
MAIQRRYEVVRQGTTFTQFGPSPDTVLSRHKSYESARRAFDRATGNIRLVEWCGTQRNVLDAAIC